jgi:hypothetical protein
MEQKKWMQTEKQQEPPLMPPALQAWQSHFRKKSLRMGTVSWLHLPFELQELELGSKLVPQSPPLLERWVRQMQVRASQS